MRPEARQALAQFIHEYGESIIKMTSSCQMFMSVKLAEYPGEKDLLIDALRRGIPERILQHAGSDDYTTRLASMSHEFAKVREIDPEVAGEVVTAWAEVLNRPVGYKKGAVPDRVYREQAPPDPKQEQQIKLVMALIAGAGGFLGTAIGAGLAGATMLVTEVAVGDTRGSSVKYAAGAHGTALTVVALAIAIKMGIAGVAGGFAAVGGWLMGSGDQRPWAGFAAAFGTGFSLAMIFLSYSSSLIRIVGIAVAVFGATFTIAARGGLKA